jgi:hypothetical protein
MTEQRSPVRRRGLVAAAVEVVLAVAAGWLAFWLWPHGIATITMVLDDGTTLVSTRYYGNWMALAIVAGTAAALFVSLAVRSVLLASRPR